MKWTLLMVAMLSASGCSPVQVEVGNRTGKTIVKTEQCFFERGPYWFKSKSQTIYKCTASDGSVYWVRRDLFRTEIKQ